MKAPDFAGASREALAFLHSRLRMGLWMVTRTDGHDWIVLTMEDHAYRLEERLAAGLALRWDDTLCARMVDGRGPRAVPDVDAEPAYADAPLRGSIPIRAYVGAPLFDAQGKVFGTLCGFDPEPLPASLAAEAPIVGVIADLLSGLLSAELQGIALAREARAARGEALVDPLTGLSNRRAWEHALAAEEERCRRYGAPACVIAIQLETPTPTVPPKRPVVVASGAGEEGLGIDEANDETGDDEAIVAARLASLLSATQALQQVVRKPDTLARTDDQTFCVLGVECNSAEALALLTRLEHGLHHIGMPAALGMARRSRSERLDDTEQRAFDAMEEHARARANDRLVRPPAPAA